MKGFFLTISQHKSLKWSLYIGVILLSIFYIIKFFFSVNGDESILSEQAKMLFLNGTVSSPMFEGLGQSWEISQLHYHKLYIWLGAVVYAVFGSSLYGFRLIPLIYFGFSLLIVYKLFSKQDFKKYKFLFFILLLLSNSTFFSFGLIYRPEIALMFFAIASFWFLNRYFNNKKYKYIIGSAIMSGLGALSHLNGLSICFAGFVLLVVNKKYLYAFYHGVISGIVVLFYFIDINTKEKLNQFLTQFSADPNLSSTDFSVFGPLIKLVNEHMRFFWTPEVSVFSALLIFTLIFSWKYIIRKHKNLLLYSILLATGLAMIAHGKNTNYALFIIPFYTMIISFGLDTIFESQTNVKRNIIIGFLSVFLILNITKSITHSKGFYLPARRSEILAENMPIKNVKVYAPYYFFYNQEKNFIIAHPFAYHFSKFYIKNKEESAKDFYNYNSKLNTKYIVLDSRMLKSGLMKKLQYDNLHLHDSIFQYSVVYENNYWKILEKYVAVTGQKQ